MFTAAQLYGTTPQVPINGSTTPTQPLGVYGMGHAHGYRSLVDPHNPITWLGVFLLATVGLAGVSGSARLGPAHASAGIGKD